LTGGGPEGLTPELLDEIREIFSDRIPFNHLIGLQLIDLTDESARFRFEMREELVGNYVRKTLHGGVITSALDVTGGLVALLGALKREHRSVAEIPELFGRLGTIDLRVDFMRPGSGRHFESSGYVLRAGSRVAVSRTELSNDEGRIVAVGTGAYIVV
jgi:uncharacterized protein (TIGR00369 family)